MRTTLQLAVMLLVGLALRQTDAQAQQPASRISAARTPVQDVLFFPGARATSSTTANRVAARTCSDVNSADFSGRTIGEDWKVSRTLTTEGTSVSSAGYTSNPTNATSALAVQDVVYGRVLYWTQDFSSNGTLATTNTNVNRTTLTLNLNRSVSGFALTINDIDRVVGNQTNNGWTDLVQFDGYATATSTTPITLTAADVTLGTNNTNAWNGNNQVIGTNNNGTVDGNVTVLFPSAVTKVVITYKNAQTTYADPGSQIIGIADFSWCASADAYTTLTGPGSLSAGVVSGNYTATFGNNGPDNLATQTRVVSVPANTASAVSAPGATVTGSQATGWTLTYPAATGVAAATSTSYNFTIRPLPGTGNIAVTSTTTTTTNQTSTTNDQATVTYPVTQIADLTTTLTGPGSLAALPTATLPSGNYTVTYTNNGPSIAASVTRTVTIPTAYVSAVTPSAGSVATVGSNFVITFPAATNVASGNTVSYTFTVTPKNSGTSAGQTITATSTTAVGTGGTSQGANTAPDQASVSYIVNNTADISAAFTSPTAASTTATAGTTVNYTVQYTNAGPATANSVTRTVSIPAGVPGVTAPGGTVTGDQTNGWTITYPGGNFSTGNSVSYSFSIVAPATGPITLTANTTTTSGQTNTGNNSSTRTLNVTPIVLSGTIFDDVNYGGGAGRDYATANTSARNSAFADGAIRRPGATVELYDAAGDYVASTTTNAAGLYSFNVPSAATYRVRVVNSTVTSVRASTATGLLGTQTYVYNDVNRVGGEEPALLDAPANTTDANLSSLTAGTGITATTAQSIKQVVVPTAGLTTVDFGFNFDVITNTRDSGAGSLRQFITNARALSNTNLAQVGQTAGVEASIFMISNGSTTTVPAGMRSGVSGGAASNGVATITLASALPSITGANAGATTLTGLTQSGLYGNQSQPVSEQTTGPEVIVDFNGANGFGISAANARVISMGFTGANPTGGSTTAAISITAGATSALLQDNTFYNNGSNLRINGVGGATITGNISRNALANNSDGIEVTGSSSNTITNNQFINNAGYGIDFIGGTSTGNTITGNLFKSNGQTTSDGQTAGIGIRSTGAASNNIIGNTFTANVGDGISSRGGSNNIFSQNSFYANGDLGIDLTATTNNDGDGVTLNETDDVDGTTTANGLINFPVITAATIRNGNLIVQGFARPGVTVELYVAAPDGTGFGEGQTYFRTFVEGSVDDKDAGTSTYAGLINDIDQGTDNTNRFTVSIPLASLTADQRTALTANNAQLTALATLATNTANNYGTSEFSGTAPVFQAPVANNDADSTTPGTAITLTVTSNDQYSIDPATVALNGLAAGNTTAVAVTGGTFQFLSSGQVQFTPAAGFTGIATVPYTVNNTSGTVSNTAYISVEVRNPAIDLATTISAPANNTAINGGTALTYTVAATNNSGTAVSGVVETLQLPAGLTTGGATVAIAGGANAASATYDNATGLVSIPVGTLAASSTQTYSVAVSAMPGSGPITATANISGSGTETNTANNTAATTVTINPRYDVATTLSGPATGVVRGNEVTYSVTTSNLSTTAGSVSVAPNVIQTVQLPMGLTGVYASNGGTYNSGNGVVTFPAIAALPVGQTVVNSISFVAPSANFAALTATVTAGASSNNAGDINSPTSGTTNNNAANLNNSTAAVATVAGSSAVNVYTTISSSASVVAPSGSVTLTVVTGNAGPASAAGVIETLQLPAGLTANGAVTVSNGGSYNNTTGLVTFASIGTLASGATNPVAQTVTFVAPTQGFVLATATAYTTSADVLPADNLAQTKVEITPRADVATTLAGPATVVPGQVVTYTVTTTSNAEGTASGVVQRVLLPAGLTGVTVSNGSYDAATGIVTISFPNALAKGFTQTNSISYTVPAGATSYVATANVSSSTPETVLTNNSAAVTTTVQAAVDVQVAVSGPASAPAGSPVTYVVTSTNNGPSVATGVATTLQLPAGLTVGGTVTVTGGGSYDNATGLVSFTSVSVLANGGSYSNSVTVVMPDASQLSGVARVSSTTAETNLDNNVASVATTGTTPTGTTAATTANLATTITASATSVAPGASVTVTANFSNVAGSATASTVTPSIALPAGLSAFGTVTVAGGTGGSYDNTTGLVTWNSVGTLAGGASLPANKYKVTFNAPRNGAVTATSVVASATSDIVPDNNVQSTTINVTATADPATSISGPVSVQPGATVSYAVMTLNNGVSLASSTQAVTIPSGATNITYSGATGPVAVANGTTLITFPAISNQVAGLAGEITNYVTFTAPAANYTVTATLTPASATGDVTGNNTAAVATAINRTPVAYNVVNSLQTPEANTAGSLLISPLAATDADATQTLTYAITSLPVATSGDLYLGTTKVTALSQVASLSTAQISTLRFDPAAGFIGNAFFTYTATDNATTATGTSIAATSNTATYTIAVGQDVTSVYTSTPLKGGANPYQNNDVIAYVTDTNGARYTSAGVVYNATTGILESGASNGLPTTGNNVSTDAAGTALLASLGLGLNTTTGQIYVVDRTKLRTSGSYTISLTTVDVNGGTNTQTIGFSIGTRPLPVELKAFDVTAQNYDAKLAWSTASEKDNDHFDVERSFDGRTFERITQVRGQGTTSQTTTYAFTDANVGSKHQGLIYYRLQQVDTDGTAVYSPVRTVSFSARTATEVKLSVFPNPATSQDRTATLDLSTLPTGAYQATLLDATGRSMGTYQVQGGVNKALDVQSLPSGTYIVLVRGNNLNLNVRLIKE
ncbi:beta strand repeat-containing protein [Hymenobacter sediminicola]|uniref:Right-handed parallel beta-helix repeat-containing protein n=1 Tax=Hymenobacter sediminicola TaxID=2761579 RepID=A0A7G7W7X8_9BACT|nr:right-handed parallel beta-helix repeat-containing protein [Hymenobacter sediminicola]QNH62471.1 right-handed parallel beta-helix repeat-containing protein [Hymenobacter sediminicola]